METVTDHENMVNRLKKAIMEADFNGTPKLTQEALDAGVEPEVIMKKAILETIQEMEEKYYGEEKPSLNPLFFMSMESARRSLALLEPWFKKGEESLGIVVLGVPSSDNQDMGTKFVAMALTAAGFDVVYLGRDTAPSKFVDKVIETGAQILGISCYVTTGYQRVRKVLELLSEAKIRDRVKVMVGGTVITEKFADKHNLDYARTASGAVELALSYVGGK